MLYVILGVIIGVIYGFKDEDIVGAILLGIAGFTFGLVAWFIIGLVGIALPTVESVETQEIYALNDSSELEGQKFLFSGYIEENLVYRYVVESDKGKHIEECSVNDAYIKDIKSDSPYVEFHTYEFKHGWFGLFAMNWKSLCESYYVFYVPNGTVTNEYNVDLK